jgi:hypothetical protein
MVLALPPAWCCMAWRTAAEEESCCMDCCCPVSRSDSQPVDEDKPPAPRLKECCLSKSTLPPEPKVLPVDPDLVTAAMIVVTEACAPVTALDTPVESPVFSPPLQILHCTWLC